MIASHSQLGKAFLMLNSWLSRAIPHDLQKGNKMFYFKRGTFLKATGKLWAFAMEQNNYMYNFPEEALKNLICLKKY